MNNREIELDIVNDIWNMLAQYPWHPVDIYPCILYLLYGIHKEYPVVVDNDYNGGIHFEMKGDDLLDDLYYSSKACVTRYANDSTRFSHELLLLLTRYNRDYFEAKYVDILYSLNYRLSVSNTGEFLTPHALNKLIAYFVNNEGCDRLYDPFCGSASIVQYLQKDKGRYMFVGQDLNMLTSLIARVNIEANSFVDGRISCKDSIDDWDRSCFDAVASCPPFGILLSRYQRQLIEKEYDNIIDSVEGILFSRAFRYNEAKLVVALLPLGFCDSPKHKRLRKYLVDNNFIDTIIFLPDKLLFGTSIPCVLAICKRYRDVTAPIKFIDAQSYFIGESARTRSFDCDAFIRDYETNLDKFCSYVSSRDIIAGDYSLNLYLYDLRRIELKEGQQMVPFGSLMKEVQKERVPFADTYKVFPTKNFSADFIEVLLNKDKLASLSEERSQVSKRLVKVKEGRKYILSTAVRSSKPRYALYTGKVDFLCSADVEVFEVNEDMVSPEYLAYLLTNNLALKTGKFPLTHILKLSTTIDSPENQKEIVKKLTQEHAARERAEQEADAKRLGVKNNISDLEHMLSTTYANIDDVFYKLGKMHSSDGIMETLLKELKDNFEYLKQVIQYNNANIATDSFNLEEQDIEAFIRSYCDAWNNYSGKYFGLSLRVNLGEHKTVLFDATLLKVMLDSILTNVERHGFNKHKNDANQVEISLSLEKYEEMPYVVMRVANNGAPFKSGFTINDYITRGRYSAKSGRSGLGGYHVYQITKGHRGFLYIDSNKIWNVIIEILLPIHNVESDNLVEYEHECI